MNLEQKRVLVLGFGREGRSAARFLSESGSSVVAVDARTEQDLTTNSTDALDFELILGEQDPRVVERVDVIVTSPGIPSDNPILIAATQLGVPVTNATQLFFDRCPCPIVGVTGSSGKSTTASLITAILRCGPTQVRLGGNIGEPMLDMLADLEHTSIAVVELSSFQLERLSSSPHVAVMTNIAPNHLDRHGSMPAYIEAKANIVRYQSPTDFAIFNANDPALVSISHEATSSVMWFSRTEKVSPGAYLLDGQVILAGKRGDVAVLAEEEVPVPGRHNLDNVAAALAATSALGATTEEMRAGTIGFRGLPHRLELVARIGEVSFVDDSIATSPDRAAVAIQATASPIVLIAGGRSKRLPWLPMIEAFKSKAKALVVLGEAAQEIQQAARDADIEAPIIYASGLEDAVSAAMASARPGDTVLLAPGCTSYDMFSNFEERGSEFRRIVEEIDGRSR